jgi:hypothetical protein
MTRLLWNILRNVFQYIGKSRRNEQILDKYDLQRLNQEDKKT